MFFTEVGEPRYDEYSAGGELSLTGMLKMMENVAGHHAAKVRDPIVARKIAWVLVEWRLEAARRPKASEPVRITTWARGKPPATITFRDFYAEDGSGGEFFRASSKFALVDLEKNKLTSIGVEDLAAYEPEERRVFETDLPRLRPFADCEAELAVPLRRSDIDFNGHVHNTRYLDFALELLPEEIYRRDALSRLRIEYRAPLKPGDCPVIRRAKTAEGYQFGIFAGGQPCTWITLS